jgi:hypothetical protein
MLYGHMEKKSVFFTAVLLDVQLIRRATEISGPHVISMRPLVA